MDTLMMLGMFAVAAFLVAWVVNGLVHFLSGEKPRYTGSPWLEGGGAYHDEYKERVYTYPVRSPYSDSPGVARRVCLCL